MTSITTHRPLRLADGPAEDGPAEVGPAADDSAEVDPVDKAPADAAVSGLADASGAPRPIVAGPAPTRPMTARPITARPFTARPVAGGATDAPVIRLVPRRAESDDVIGEGTGEGTERAGPTGEGDAGPDTAASDAPGSGARPIADIRRVHGIARSLGLAIIEVLAGSRSPQQMARWLDLESYERLIARTWMTRAREDRDGSSRLLHRGATVGSTRLCRIREDVYEVSLVVSETARVRAMAMRLELRRGLWKVTALEIG